jgi:hypothetical protein
MKKNLFKMKKIIPSNSNKIRIKKINLNKINKKNKILLWLIAE